MAPGDHFRLLCHTADTLEPGATHKVQNKGLCIVVGIMGDKHGLVAVTGTQLREPCVTQFPSRHFYADAVLCRIGGSIEVLHMALYAGLCAPVANQGLVGIGISNPARWQVAAIYMESMPPLTARSTIIYFFEEKV